MNTSLATPIEWWNRLNQEFSFTLDAAADDDHHMGNIAYITPEQNAFHTPWTGRIWCSPPWAKETLGLWVAHGYEACRYEGAELVVMLLPVRPTDDWWFHYALRAFEIRFIKGALDFVPFDKEVKFFHVEPHCLLIFRRPQDIPDEWVGTFVSAYPAR